MVPRWLLLVGAVLAGAGAVLAADPAADRPVFVVAPSGDDAAPGSAERPWRTISHAARSVPPGAIVDVRGGTYAERVEVEVSGRPGAPITFREHPGESVVISGAGLKGLTDAAGLIHVDGRSGLEFVGFEIRDLRDASGRAAFTPAGVWITGAASDVTLRGLDVHDITTRRGDAHGIAVYGTSGEAPITGVTIEGCYVHDLRLGSSEAIVINGNVDGWRVVGNRVDDTDNIGIDAIGFEGTAPRDDRARNGLIADNVVSDVDTRGNPAYVEDGENCRCAGGIYVDGGTGIVIERNRVTRSNLGIELASEARQGSTSDVVVRNNLVTRSDRAGLTMGGYDAMRGRTERVRVVNNTFLDNDRLGEEVGEIELNYRVSDSSFLNNVFGAGPAAIMVTNAFRQNARNVFDGNVWHARGTAGGDATWQWRTRELEGFAAWRRASRGDARGSYRDPRVGLDGRPRAGSPLVDGGVDTPLSGATDLAGAPRVQGRRIDVGALESAP